MKLVTLLPADQYIVVNKTILTEVDKRNLIHLYEPIYILLYGVIWID